MKTEELNEFQKETSPLTKKSVSSILRIYYDPENNNMYKTNKKPNEQKVSQFQIFDQMTIKQLKHQWYTQNKTKQALDENEETYLMFWNDEFAILNDYTIKIVKQYAKISQFNEGHLIKIYHDNKCPYKESEQITVYQNYARAKIDSFNHSDLNSQEILKSKKCQNIVLWIDKNVYQNFQTFMQITKLHKLTRFVLVQLTSNQEFKQWLSKQKKILQSKYLKIHFISNMNRPPDYKQQGITTLNMIRQTSPNSLLIYYIGNVGRAQESLRAANKHEDKNVELASSFDVLEKIFIEKLNVAEK